MQHLKIFLLQVLSLSVDCALYLSFGYDCPNRMFRCNNGKCIPRDWLCDLENDCGDLSDELSHNCSPLAHRSCEPSEFMCSTGRCIPRSWTCDYDLDCSGGEDEAPSLCNKKVSCPSHTCGSGQCIPSAWVCDGTDDCLDGTDEVGCVQDCSNSTNFLCDNGACVVLTLKCNGEDDCGDGSDERDCHEECDDDSFKCSDGPCISKEWKCDGYPDCEDESDEADCTTPKIRPRACKENEFLCHNLIACIPTYWLCNGNPECLDGSDEENCDNVTCRLDEFQCSDRKCVPGYSQCNGKSDCDDGSDEVNCGTEAPACKDDEFHCGAGMCIPLSRACNGFMDCPKGEDEPPDTCHVNECEIVNGGCSEICVDTPTSYHCKCKKGFELIDNFTCVDLDECKNGESCSQVCINEKGTFKCECNDGYTRHPLDHRRCKATVGEPKLIFTRRHDIRMLNLSNNKIRLIQNFTNSSIALDFLYRDEYIFWSDGSEKKIYSSKISDEIDEKMTVVNKTFSDGLAVDWIYNHIYWTDVEQFTIKVADFDGSMQKTLIMDALGKPRAIVVNPLEGWLFFTDWGRKPRIERVGLDGSLRSVIVSQDIRWPNGLALDLLKRRLYWIDAYTEHAFSANYDGSARKIVLKPSEHVSHPFSITLFEDTLYWTDWKKKTIYKADLLGSSNSTPVTEEGSIESPMVVHVYHPYRQPEHFNYCLQRSTEEKCSHLCLLTPQSYLPSDVRPTHRTSCACPDGLILREDGRSCVSKKDSQNSESSSKSESSGKLIVRIGDESSFTGLIIAVVVSLCILLIVGGTVMMYSYRRYLRRDVGSISFVNQIYRRNSQDNIPKNEHLPAETSFQPLYASD